MKKEIILLAGTLAFGELAAYLLAGWQLAAIYLLLWTDKMLLRAFLPLRWTGIELTTLASVFAAMAYGPMASFALVVSVAVVMRAARFYALPIREPDFPIFLPHPYVVVDGLGGYVAGLAAAGVSGFFWLAVVVVLFKFFAYGLTAMLFFGKGFGLGYGLIYIGFNLLLLFAAGDAFAAFVGLTA